MPGGHSSGHPVLPVDYNPAVSLSEWHPRSICGCVPSSNSVLCRTLYCSPGGHPFPDIPESHPGSLLHCFRFLSECIVSVQKNGGQPIFPGAEQPHERLAFCTASGLPQDLYPGLVCHEESPLQKLTMEVIIQRLEIMFRTVDDPVCKGRTADGCSVFLPVLFLTVKWHAVRVLLVDRPCNHKRGSRTFPNECRCCFGFDDHSFFDITCLCTVRPLKSSPCVTFFSGVQFLLHRFKRNTHTGEAKSAPKG